MSKRATLMRGECLKLLRKIPDASVDLVLVDLPFGTTENHWDSVIDLTKLWKQYHRVCKPNAAFVLFAAQPFTTQLISSNWKEFKYTWVWIKDNATGFLNAKKQPLRNTEDVCVFYRKQCLYRPQMTDTGKAYKTTQGGASTNYREFTKKPTSMSTGERYPLSTLKVFRDFNKWHPTQKPVELLEYFIETYTKRGMTVLDNCMGSGSTGVACMLRGRRFVGMELDKKYFRVAKRRILHAQESKAPLKKLKVSSHVAAKRFEKLF